MVKLGVLAAVAIALALLFGATTKALDILNRLCVATSICEWPARKT
ncbi:hypothetical protein ABOZ73_06410 [Caulobacter sp. 73W]|uniref:Uncharacterized protein n=1 Tax=Caulobacter sp. 73W TaxID=3161137 RepID=A0AB39KZQ4_9CAUL